MNHQIDKWINDYISLYVILDLPVTTLYPLYTIFDAFSCWLMRHFLDWVSRNPFDNATSLPIAAKKNMIRISGLPHQIFKIAE